MMRRRLTDSIHNDLEWNGCNYTTQPRAFRTANVWFGMATIGGSQAYYKAAPTRVQAVAGTVGGGGEGGKQRGAWLLRGRA